MRIAAIAATVTLSAFAVLTAGCSASDEPAAVTTTTVAPAPPAATATSATTSAPATGTASATSATATPQVISVTVAGGQVTPAPAPVAVKAGDTVVIEVTSDKADELHVHGYDKTLALPAGQPTRLELLANIPGQFDVELHSTHLLLFTLRVS